MELKTSSKVSVWAPMHITQRPQAESVATTERLYHVKIIFTIHCVKHFFHFHLRQSGVPWVNVAINHCVVPGGRNFENLTNLKK